MTYGKKDQALIDKVETDHKAMMEQMDGRGRLWHWFGLSYASWLTLPRVVLHEMPDEWQYKMAQLLEELDETFPDKDMIMPSTTVRAVRPNGKLMKMPEFLNHYRHPWRDEINKLKS